MKRLAVFLLLAWVATAAPAMAQEGSADDKSFLEDWLETNLSGAGREVTVTGFAGALSSQARLESLTIADDQGIWLTLRDAQLDWTRSALISGRLEISTLSAGEIEISRRPSGEAGAGGPSAEASDFALPDLPVSIQIGRLSAARVVLGAPVLGVAAELRLDGAASLEGGAGEARFSAERIDGAVGSLALDGSYANETAILSLDLRLDEGPDGILSTLAGLPGGVPVSLALNGEGPVDRFSATLDLVTDGAKRLGGQLDLSRGDGQDGNGEVAPLVFRAELAGDPRALFAPDYGAFFGPDTRLALDGQRGADGRLVIDRLDVATQALRLSGSAVIGAGGWPDNVLLSGEVAAQGGPVLLPLAGPNTRIGRAEIGLKYDAEAGDEWTARVALAGFERGETGLGSVTLDAAGKLERAGAGVMPSVAGRLEFAASGITIGDPEMARAVGPGLAGEIEFRRESGAPLDLTALALRGEDYSLNGALALGTDWTRLDLVGSGSIDLAAQDISRFAGLAGRDLAGQVKVGLSGTAALPGGPFDIEVQGAARDLAFGVAQADRLFAGESTMSIRAARDTSGTRVEHFAIRAKGATAEGSAGLGGAGGEFTLNLSMPDAAILGNGPDGPLSLAAAARRVGAELEFEASLSAPGQLRAQLEGTAEWLGGGLGRIEATGTAAAARIDGYSALAGRSLAGSGNIAIAGSIDPRSAAFAVSGNAAASELGLGLGDLDRLFAGESRAGLALRRDEGGTIQVDTVDIETPEITANLSGVSDPQGQRIDARAALRDLGLLVPGLSGRFDLEGGAVLNEAGWSLGGSGQGPGGTTVRIGGLIGRQGDQADLQLSGQAPLALANSFIAPNQISGTAAFNLTLRGPLALSALGGSVTTDNARASLPALRLALDPLAASAQLSDGRAAIEASGTVSSGGRISVSGPVALASPFSSDLDIRLDRVVLSDPSLFRIGATGTLALTGPLAGGALIAGGLDLRPAEIRVPETGFGVDGSLEGLQHIGEPVAVSLTRARAGLGPSAEGSGAVAEPYRLDLQIDAPNSVFVRGRGLDAELGGSLRLGGSTADVVAQGGFELIRGRLDILGNRLALTEGGVTLQGDLDPVLNLVAETNAEDVVVRIALDGSASAPEVAFSSSPDLPEDEILALLIFGRGLDKLSAFQALKLANAVVTLAGKGGTGTIGRLRKGFGLDDLDVTTGDDGTLAVRAGTYVTENIYTDFTIGTDGRTEINLNLPLTPELTAKGSLSSDGNTGVGITFEKNY